MMTAISMIIVQVVVVLTFVVVVVPSLYNNKACCLNEIRFLSNLLTFWKSLNGTKYELIRIEKPDREGVELFPK